MAKHVLDNVLSKTLTVDDTDAQSMVARFPARFSIVKDAAPADPFAITPAGSPFTWNNTTGQTVTMICTGGTVTLIEVGRGGVFLNTGIIVGPVRVSVGDAYRVTYSVAPTLNALP